MPKDLLPFFKSLPTFAEVPNDSLTWMIQCGEIKNYDTGEFLFSKGSPVEYMYVILEGDFEAYQITNRGREFFVELVKGDITSLLPYSRLKEATAYAEAKQPSKVFGLHKDYFRTMIADHYELTAALVHHMTSRVRNFTTMQVQNEKLAALGKLSAGLAHELNNPSSAMVRSASELAKLLKQGPDNFKKLLNIDMEEHQVNGVQALLTKKIESSMPTLSMMQRNEMEEDIADWLEAHGESNGFDYAELFVAFGFEVSELEGLYQLLGSESLTTTLEWMHGQLDIVRIVREIEDGLKGLSVGKTRN